MDSFNRNDIFFRDTQIYVIENVYRNLILECEPGSVPADIETRTKYFIVIYDITSDSEMVKFMWLIPVLHFVTCQ